MLVRNYLLELWLGILRESVLIIHRYHYQNQDYQTKKFILEYSTVISKASIKEQTVDIAVLFETLLGFQYQ